MFQWAGFNPEVSGTRVTGFPGLAAVALLPTLECSDSSCLLLLHREDADSAEWNQEWWRQGRNHIVNRAASEDELQCVWGPRRAPLLVHLMEKIWVNAMHASICTTPKPWHCGKQTAEQALKGLNGFRTWPGFIEYWEILPLISAGIGSTATMHPKWTAGRVSLIWAVVFMQFKVDVWLFTLLNQVYRKGLSQWNKQYI